VTTGSFLGFHPFKLDYRVPTALLKYLHYTNVFSNSQEIVIPYREFPKQFLKGLVEEGIIDTGLCRTLDVFADLGPISIGPQ